MAATIPPLFRGTASSVQDNDGSATLTLTTPSDLMPGDIIVVVPAMLNTSALSQDQGVTLTEFALTGQSQTNTKTTVLHAIARAPASAGAGVSQDANTSIRLTSVDITKSWGAVMFCVRRGHQVLATAFGDAVKGLSGAGQNTYAKTGCTPGASNTTLVTIFTFSSGSDNVTQSWPATVDITGGGTDSQLASANFMIPATASQRARGVSVYLATGSPTNGAVASTRTVTMVTPGTTGSIGGYSIAIRPMLGAQNDVIYTEVYKGTPDDATVQVADIHYPTSAYGGTCGAAIYFHGGITSGNRYLDLTKHYIPQEVQAQGVAIIAIEWRQTTAGVRGGEPGLNDQHTALRYFLANAASYNLDPTKFYLVGNSAGATGALVLAATLNNSNYYGASPENSGTSETIRRVLAFFPGSNHTFQDAWKTALSISNPSPSCNSGSDIGYALGTGGTWFDLCNEERWNATAYPAGGATQDATESMPNNKGDPAWWAQYGASVTRPPTYLLHGDADTTVAYGVSNHEGGSGRPPGLYQQFRSNGGPIFYTQLTSTGHGINAAGNRPSAEAGATHGATIDQACLWLAEGYRFPGPRAVTVGRARGF